MTEFVVKAGQFEGPLDLLLDLIEKKKLHISDVSLAKVTDDFIEYVRRLEQFSIEKTAHFVLTASTLLLIKSKALLPNLALSEEEEADIAALEERLRKYKRIKELSRHIDQSFGKNILFMKSKDSPIDPIFSPEESITKNSILDSIRKVFLAIPIKNTLPRAVVEKVISLEEMVEKLISKVQSSLRLSFRDFSKGAGERKVDVIVSFLAMLELVKQGIINVSQESRFSDIEMESSSVDTPRYSSL